MSLLALLMLTLIWTSEVVAGASCVVAKRLGNSLAIEWVASPSESVDSAVFKAKRRLIEQGYRKRGQGVHVQASTGMRHAHMVIVRTAYTTMTGRNRISYGCGYSQHSARQAEQAALQDLSSYSWGWKPEMGYEVMESIRY